MLIPDFAKFFNVVIEHLGFYFWVYTHIIFRGQYFKLTLTFTIYGFRVYV